MQAEEIWATAGGRIKWISNEWKNRAQTVVIIGWMSAWVTMRPKLTTEKTENVFVTGLGDEPHNTEIKSLGPGNEQVQVPIPVPPLRSCVTAGSSLKLPRGLVSCVNFPPSMN